MPIRPAILIGLGGTGSAIVRTVRQRVIETTAHDDRLRQDVLDRRFQFFSVDSREAGGEGFAPDYYHSVALRQAKRTVDQLWNADQFFREWWYQHHTNPGTLVNGCGTVPIHGRLCFRTDAGSANPSLIGRISQGMGIAANVVEDARGEAIFRIYLVSSVCGGTGSGMMLTLGYQIRDLWPDQQIVAVCPLASLMELRADETYWDHIWANGHAALCTFDFWQSQDATSKRHLFPFFVMPDGSEIRGDMAPFDITYVFTRRNRSGLALSSFNDYMSLIAEGLFLEIFSSISESADERYSDFFTALRDIGSVRGRSITFGSFAVSSLRFPVQLIVEYLSTKLGIQVLEEDLLTSGQGNEAGKLVRQFLEDHKLRQQDIIPRLEQTRQDRVVPAPLDFEAELLDAEPGSIAHIVDEYRKEERQRLGIEQGEEEDRPTLIDLIRANRQDLVADLSEVIGRQVLQLMEERDSGVVLAREWVEMVAAELDTIRAAYVEEREGNPAKLRPGIEGKGGSLEQLERAKGQAVQTILEEYEGFRIRRDVAGKKKTFVEAWWDPWCANQRRSLILREVIAFLDELLDEINVWRSSFSRLARILQDIRDELTQDLPTILHRDARRADYVLEDLVLTDRDAVEDLFWQSATRTGIGLYLITSDRGGLRQAVTDIARLLRDKRIETLDAQKASMRSRVHDLLLQRASNEFLRRVRSVSLWQALAYEAEAKGHTTGAEIRTYIDDRIQETAARCRPFWEIGAGGQDIQAPENVQIALSTEAALQFSAAKEWSAWAPWQTIGDHYDSGDPHTFLIRRAEGGFPPYALVDARQSEREFQAFRSRFPRVIVQVDRRYEENIPMTLEPIEEQSTRVTFLMAEKLNVIESPLYDDKRGAYVFSGDVISRGREDAIESVIHDPQLRARVEMAVQNALRQYPRSEWDRMYEETREHLETARRLRRGQDLARVLERDVADMDAFLRANRSL